MKTELTKLKTIINKMQIEKLVFGSLRDEKLTPEFIEKFIDTMETTYNANILALKNISNEMEKNLEEKDGK